MLIYADSLIEFKWFQGLSESFKNSEYIKIIGRNKNPPIIEEIIKYDRPDIILVDKESHKPLLILEKTREVPTGHNVGQRTARMVRAAEMGIPFIFFMPFRARKHGRMTTILNMNARLIKAMLNIWEIHKTPTILINWKCDSDGELINDGTHNKKLEEVLPMFLNNGSLKNDPTLIGIKNEMLNEYKERVKTYKDYANPPNSLKLYKTEKLIDSHYKNLSEEDLINLKIHNESAVYEIGMQPESSKRQDPYTGMQFIYDFIYCRVGPSPEQKKRNLILYFPNLQKEFWLKTNPNNKNTKSSNWYLCANGLLFKNGYLQLR